jgi:spermidine synthase
MSDTSPSAKLIPLRRGLIAIVSAALFLSGVASVVNQVVWQRALKIFLGGSETISSMIVVLVFLLGLGLGAAWMGMRSRNLAHPLRVFGLVELGLFGVNILIAVLLSLDLSETVYGAQRIAQSAGIPLRVVYALGSMLVLLPPTLLMGATLPVASEACQRQLGATRSSLITVLFCLNTLGAVLGAFGSSFYLMPYFGQLTSLSTAAASNLGAAALLLALATRVAHVATPGEPMRVGGRGRRWRQMRMEEALGLALGFLSLGYEMYLFRLIALIYEPLPYTFSTTLCLYLLFWSIGAYLASWLRDRLSGTFLTGAALVAGMPLVYEFDRFDAEFALFGGGLIYFLPCVMFGLLFGGLVSRSVRAWGSDVGRFYAFNTVGACSGIAFFTLLGYEFPHDYNAFLIGLGMLGFFLFWLDRKSLQNIDGAKTRRIVTLAGCIGILVVIGLLLFDGATTPYSNSKSRRTRTYWGRDGVVEVLPNQAILFDGLWHSRMSHEGNHVGRSYTWMMAMAAVLSHQKGGIEEVLVIGNGVGITAATLAKLDGAHVDAYEINHTLKHVLRDYEEATLHVGIDPRIKIRWTDARSGLALDPKTYDIIVSAPLHLRQAGSGILLSVEYFELLKARLRPNGVVAVYSHEGAPGQAHLVRRTVKRVFPHLQTFDAGVLLIASADELHVTRKSIDASLSRPGALYAEAAAYDRAQRRSGGVRLRARLDVPSAPTREGRYVITDNHPLVEYPEIAEVLIDVP